MKPRHFIAAAVSVALIAGLGIYASYSSSNSQATKNVPTQSQAPGIDADNLPEAALMVRPEVRRYQDRMDFQSQARRFFDQASSLSAATRNQQAQSLRLQVDRYEREGDLSAGEAVALRIGVIRATETEPERQAELLADVIARYKMDTERRNLAFREAQRNDRAFNHYKASEASIVAEVMAMKQIPGGLSRNDYLRQRLQHEREVAYRGR